MDGFEGAEKTLEIEFVIPKEDALGLRRISIEDRREMFTLAKCAILNTISNETFDAHLLSESSCFVSRDRFLCKTCGTTQLLKLIPKLLSCTEAIGAVVDTVYFSRKDYLFPEKQVFPHVSFDDEAAFLNQYFKGAAYVPGQSNKEHWYLYIADNTARPISDRTNQTLEIMMSEIDPEILEIFRFGDSRPGVPEGCNTDYVTDKLGIQNLVPGSQLDTFLFLPCGYSMNGLLGSSYWTIHVTPEAHCSYISFETNWPQANYSKLIGQVVEMFRPGKFTLALYAERNSVPSNTSAAFNAQLNGYELNSKVIQQFGQQCQVTVCHYDNRGSTSDSASDDTNASDDAFLARIQDGWFHERGRLWPGMAKSLQVKEILYQSRSKYQDVLVFNSATWGNVLVLDGVIQCTERDEFSYQEMICHIPMMAHAAPKSVLVVGGGDGGVLREVIKHPGVERVVLVEIDEAVVNVSKKYLPNMAAGFNDPRVTVIIGDGAAYMREQDKTFDVIITDSSDPIGPADVLFERPYYEAMQRALKEGGIVCSQAESPWLHLDIIEKLVGMAREIFPAVEYAYTSVPTYPSGLIGFALCSTGGSTNVPVQEPECVLDKCRFYSPDMHRAAFVLPRYVKDRLK